MVNVVWPFFPEEFRDRYEFNTNINPSFDDEEREALRRGAYRSLTVRSKVDEENLTLVEDIFRRVNMLGHTLMVPLWPQAVTVSGVFGSGQTSIPVPDEMRDWFTGYALVFESPQKFEIVEIDNPPKPWEETTGGSLTLTDPTVVSYSSPIVIPLLPCFFIRPVDIRRGGFNDNTVIINVRGFSDLRLEQTSWQVVDGFRILDNKSVLFEGLGYTVSRPQTLVDSGSGPVDVVYTQKDLQSMYALTFYENNINDVLKLRSDLLSLKGRFEPFFIKNTYQNFLTVSGLVAGSILPLDTERTRLNLLGRSLLLSFQTSPTSVVQVTDVLSVEVVLDKSFSQQQVTEVNLLMYGRLDTDVIEFIYSSGGSARVSVTFKELPR